MEQTQPNPQRSPLHQQQPSRRSFPVAVVVLLVVLAIAGVGAGIYFWQQSNISEVKKQNAELQLLLDNPQADQAENRSSLRADQPTESDNSTQTAQLDKELLTGQVRQEQAGAEVQVGCHVLAGTLTDLSVRYGNTLLPQNSTAKQTDELGMGEEGVYGNYVVSIPADAIKDGTMYSYQCVGTTEVGEVTGGVASFTSLK
ncbi:hypothetical protein BH23PAT2_BH23PAT2_06740 [soil metagenome]